MHPEYSKLHTEKDRSMTAVPSSSKDVRQGPALVAQMAWKSYPMHSKDIVYKPTKKPVFEGKVITVSRPSHQAAIDWADRLQKKYPDGEFALISSHLNEMTSSFFQAKQVDMPTNKYAVHAVEGFLIMLQSLKDHGVDF
jgi:hypothetical protein